MKAAVDFKDKRGRAILRQLLFAGNASCPVKMVDAWMMAVLRSSGVEMGGEWGLPGTDGGEIWVQPRCVSDMGAHPDDLNTMSEWAAYVLFNPDQTIARAIRAKKRQ